jgi:carboxyl-terminal processing protease
MLPAANRGEGANLCEPDVCLTPPPPGVPVPYVNEALHCLAVPFSATTYVCMMNALFLSSEIPVTLGDDAGVLGPGPKRVGAFVEGNPIVFVDMEPAINLTCAATGNAANAEGAALVPGPVNVFYCHAGRTAHGPLGAEDLLTLQASLDEAPPPAGTMVGDGIAYLRVAIFTADVSTRFYTELRRLEAEGMRALILDLRGNPGGDLDACLRLAGDFLPAGAVLGRTVDADGDETLHRSRGDCPYAMPLAVLVDRGTASAAELFAGCMQTHGRAVVAGERTYGKGSVQALVPGREAHGAHYVTVATLTLPNGDPIEGRGVHPDVPTGGLAFPRDPHDP